MLLLCITWESFKFLRNTYSAVHTLTVCCKTMKTKIWQLHNTPWAMFIFGTILLLSVDLIPFLIPCAKKCVGNLRQQNLSAPPIWPLQKYSLTIYYPFSQSPQIALFLFLPQDWIWEICYILPALCRTYPAEWRQRSQTFQNGNPFHSPEKSLPPFPAFQYSSSFHEWHISGNVMQATKSELSQPPAVSIYTKQCIKKRTVR